MISKEQRIANVKKIKQQQTIPYRGDNFKFVGWNIVELKLWPKR